MKTKRLKIILTIFLVSSFFVLLIIPGTMAIFSEKESATINLNIETPVFTVNFNPNGGTASFESKDIPYGHEYGELPTVEKCGSTFVGWYTGLTDGIKIEESTTFNVLDEQTLYARFEDGNELYDVLKCEAERTDVLAVNRLASKYTGVHQDSMDSSKSTEDIYHFYGSDELNGSAILEKNNVVFANFCWQMIRTTDTGGVRLLYNGEPTITEVDGELQYDCSSSRPGHIGVIESVQNLSGTRLYAKEYVATLNGNSTSFELKEGTTKSITVSNTDTDATFDDIVSNYPYTCLNTTGECTKLYKVTGRESGLRAYTNVSTYSDFIGEASYHTDASSISDVGYMNNERYRVNYHNIISDIKLLTAVTLNSSNLNNYNNYRVGDSFHISDNNFYLDCNAGSCPIGSSFPDGPSSWVGLYSTHGTINLLYYFASLETDGENPILYEAGYVIGDVPTATANKYLFSEGISSNGDGTFTMTGTIKEVYKHEWYQEYSNVVNNFVCMPGYFTYDAGEDKYICSDNGEQKVGALRYIISTTKEKFTAAQIYKYGFGFESTGNTYQLVSNNNEAGTLQYIYNWKSTKTTNCFSDSTNPISECGYRTMTKSHYTCFNLSGVCDTYYYLTSGSDGGYLYNTAITGGKYVSTDLTDHNNILYLMLYQDDENGIVNETDSNFKRIIDEWYKNNIYDEFDFYVEDTIYCNDRNIVGIGPWDPNGGSTTEGRIYFEEAGFVIPPPNLECTNITDRFSVSNAKAHLTYKVGLVTHDELKLLNQNSARIANNTYRTLTPSTFVNSYSSNKMVIRDGSFNGQSNGSNLGVRPTISLIPNITYSKGNGSPTNPYVVEYDRDRNVVYPTNKDRTTVEIGDIVTIGTEEFYVVKEAETENDDLVLLARYNLNVGNNKKADATEGIQDSEVKGFVTSGTVYGNVPFSSTGYWNGLVGTSYSGTYCQNDTFTSSSNCAYVYDSNSSIKPYLDSYKNYLKGEGTTIKDIRLLSAEEVYELGCGHGEWSCVDSPSNAPSWVYETSYWLGSATDDNLLMNVWSEGTFADESCNTGVDFGVRPVIVI